MGVEYELIPFLDSKENAFTISYIVGGNYDNYVTPNVNGNAVQFLATELKHTGFGDRMRGSGKMAELVADLFRLHVRKNGLDKPAPGNMRMPRRKPEEAVTAKKTTKITDSPDFQTDLFGSV